MSHSFEDPPTRSLAEPRGVLRNPVKHYFSTPRGGCVDVPCPFFWGVIFCKIFKTIFSSNPFECESSLVRGSFQYMHVWVDTFLILKKSTF